jgi:hypothetical protein
MLPPGRVVKDYASGLLTLDALLDSIFTVVANRTIGGPGLEPSGKLSEGRLRQWTEADGAGALFAQRRELMVKKYRSPRRTLADTPDGPIRDFAYFASNVRPGRQAWSSGDLGGATYARRATGTLDGLSYWPDYERWKRGLATLAAEARSSGVDVTVWDFGGYEAIVQEPIPAKGDRGAQCNGSGTPCTTKWAWAMS